MVARAGVVVLGVALGLLTWGCTPSTGDGSPIPLPLASTTNSTIQTSPGQVVADGSATVTITVTARDAAGDPQVGQRVVFSVTGSGNTLTQPAGTTGANGVASGTLASTVAAVKTITATIGIPPQTVTLTASAEFVAGGPASLAYRTQPQSTALGAALSPAVQVEVRDAQGNVVTSGTQTVSIALSANPGSATLSGTLNRATSGGVATFDDLSLDAQGSGYTLQATCGSLSVTSDAFGITAPSLVFVTQPADVPAGAFFINAVRVAVQDGNGNTLTGRSDSITVSLNGTGTLSGTATVNASSGIATFSNLSIDTTGAKTLSATATGVTGATSAGFSVGAISATDGLGHLNASGTLVFGRGSTNDSPHRSAFSQPGGVALDATNHRLYVADTSHHRVLVFNLSNADDFTGVDRVPDVVLGQSDFRSMTASTSQAGLNNPRGLALDVGGNRLFVVDSSSNRVVVYDTSALANGMNASNVLGQANFTTSTAAFPPTAASLSGPYGAAYDSNNDRLFVGDQSNNRVVVYDTAAITNGENAVSVLGQSDFVTATTGGTTQSSLFNPQGVAVNGTGGTLFVADSTNNRVMVFDVAAITDGENAVNVLGQALFTTGGAPGVPTAAALQEPSGVAVDAGNRLFVTDGGYHRVEVFDVAAITDGENAANVLGQANFTSSGSGTAQDRVNLASAVAVSGDRAFVADTENDRVLLFDTAAIADGENASDGLGHLDAGAMNYTRGTIDDAPYPDTLNLPAGVALDATNHRLFVADWQNDRVLVFNLSAQNDFTGVDRVADVVLGAPNFKTPAAGATSASTFTSPQDVAYANDRLYVADTQSHRVVVFDTTALSNGMNASGVLGQSSLVGNGAATTQSGLNNPIGLAIDATNNRLFVADSTNNRVMVFDVAAITNGENAVNVLGQTVFTGNGAATTQAGLSGPVGVGYDSANDRLFVADTTNNRVLVFDVAAITDGENAVNVLGQSNFTASGAASTQAGVSGPRGVTYDATRNRVWVSDSGNNRCLLFNGAALTDGANATSVLGQANFTGSGTSSAATGLNSPRALTVDAGSGRLFVSDAQNSRVLVFAP